MLCEAFSIVDYGAAGVEGGGGGGGFWGKIGEI